MNRYESTKKVSLIGMISNIFLLIIKFIVATFSHSEALLADAVNSGGDIFSSLMSYIGNKIASHPSDEDHNFGHGKAEYIFSLLIGISMILVASKVFYDSLKSIFNHNQFIFSIYLVIVCIITILTKLALYLYCKTNYHKHYNILLKATMNDNRNDAILSFGTLVSVILGFFGYYYFDGIIGSLISIYIIFTGISIFLESYKILMDVSLDKEYTDNIIKYILKNKEIKKVTDFNTIATGYKYIAILTINVDGNLTTFKSHELADNLEKEIPNEFRKIYKVIIHVNPI